MLYKHKPTYNNIFKPKCDTVLTDIIEEVHDGEIEEISIPKPKKSRGKRQYLPGEKLLIKLHKQTKNEKIKNKQQKNNKSLNMDVVESALRDIVNDIV